MKVDESEARVRNPDMESLYILSSAKYRGQLGV
jgi:hypothetical protein